MEIWDGYNADGSLAGIDIPRSSENEGTYPQGLYHLVADVIVRHKDGTYLVMQRDFRKEGAPGEWEVGAGGSVLKGESAADGAVRELREETGVIADDIVLLSTLSVVHDNGVGVHYFIYLCTTDMDKNAVTLQEGETIDFKWITAVEILNGRYVPNRCVDLVKQLTDLRIIKTQRLLFRPIAVSDLKTAHLYASDREITRYMLNLPNDTEAETLKFITDAVAEWSKERPEYYEYAVTLDGFQIGGVCLYITEDRKQGELGWILNREYHGKGYAFEAANAMIELAENLKLEAVFARCDSRNTPSEALMKRLGMSLESSDGTRYYDKRCETAGELKYTMKIPRKES